MMLDQQTELTAATLPPRAQQIWNVLLGYLGKKTHCWPSRERLAGELAISTRTVDRWILFLAQLGRLEVERTQSGNRYWIPPRPGSRRKLVDNIVDRNLTKVATGTRQNWRLPLDKTGDCHSTLLSSNTVAPLDEIKSRTASASAAAAGRRATEEVMQGLQAIGLPETHRPKVEANASLAEAILAHCQFRFFGRHRLKPIESKIGYLVRCAEDPERAGFTRGADGLWQTPEGQPPRAKAGKGLGDRLAAQQAAREAQRDENERRLDEETRRLKWWQDLPDEARQRALALASDKYPLWAAKGLSSPTFVGVCITIAEELSHAE